jgi:hypothetical protein
MRRVVGRFTVGPVHSEWRKEAARRIRRHPQKGAEPFCGLRQCRQGGWQRGRRSQGPAICRQGHGADRECRYQPAGSAGAQDADDGRRGADCDRVMAGATRPSLRRACEGMETGHTLYFAAIRWTTPGYLENVGSELLSLRQFPESDWDRTFLPWSGFFVHAIQHYLASLLARACLARSSGNAVRGPSWGWRIVKVHLGIYHKGGFHHQLIDVDV